MCTMSMGSRGQLTQNMPYDGQLPLGYTNGTSHLSSAGRAKEGNEQWYNQLVRHKELIFIQPETKYFFGGSHSSSSLCRTAVACVIEM